MKSSPIKSGDLELSHQRPSAHVQVGKYSDASRSKQGASPRVDVSDISPRPNARAKVRRQHFSAEEVVEIFARRPDSRSMLTGERMRRTFAALSKQV